MLQAADVSPGSRGVRVQRLRPAELSSQRAGTVVVIDVLRMTSTAAVLMGRPSCVSLAVAATLGDLDRLSRPLADFLVVSELRGAPELGAWVDNSPVQVASIDLAGRTPVLVTTNGTRTLLAAAACAERVLLASFLDLQAVARHLADSAPPAHDARQAQPSASVLIVPAGKFATGEACIEDDLCADALEALLAGREPDLASSADVIRAHPRIRRRVEDEPGFGADLDLALQGAPRAAVLEFRALGAGVGEIVRA